MMQHNLVGEISASKRDGTQIESHHPIVYVEYDKRPNGGAKVNTGNQ